VILACAFLALARFGVGRWAAWDRRERLAVVRGAASRGPLRPALTFGATHWVAVAMSVATVALIWR